MTWPLVPVDGGRPSSYRLLAQAINHLLRREIPDFANLGDFSDDTAAAAGGVEVGQLYRTGNAIKVRMS